MTQSWPQQPNDLQYQTANAYRSAPTLVKLISIFNFIMCGLDFLYAICMLGAAIIAPIIISRSPPDPSDPPPWLIGIICGVMVIPASAAASLKLIAALKLHRFGKNARGWGLAAGIIGCTQLWCSYFCILPVALGVFTIVVMCLENVRHYLRDNTAAQASTAG